MKFDFLSGPARRAVVAAQKLARAREQPEVELEHLLAALIDVAETAEVIRRAGIDPATLRAPLQQAMAALSRKQREVFLAVTSNEPYAAIAARLGISVGAVGKRVFDARQCLKKQLVEILSRRRS